MKRAAILCALAIACSKKPTPPTTTTTVASAEPVAPGGAAIGARPKIDAAEIAVPPGKSELHVAWSVPSGTAINDEAPFAVRWTGSDGLATTPTDIRGVGKEVQSGFDVPLDVMPGSAGAQLTGDIDLVVCDTVTHSVCVPIKRRVELTFAVGAKGAPKGTVTLPLPSAKP
ncbi:MAG TPA: hypothetical protein VGH28_20245 [Polyangiaceae bacterium]|jgi:hypothetical protein